MSDIGALFPIKLWLTDFVVDPDLQGPIAKARAELKGYSEDQVHGLWNELESLLRQPLQAANIPPPTFVPKIEEAYDPSQGDLVARRGTRPVIDWVAVWLHPAVTRKNRPLVQFLKNLHPDLTLALSKVLALLVLHEAANRNLAGAMKAARMLDKAHIKLRPLLDDAIKIRRARQAGGAARAKLRKEQASEIRESVVSLAQRHLKSGREPHELAGLIAPQVGRSPHTVRRILKAAGFSKKRT
jgi:hypothetical protein